MPAPQVGGLAVEPTQYPTPDFHNFPVPVIVENQYLFHFSEEKDVADRYWIFAV